MISYPACPCGRVFQALRRRDTTDEACAQLYQTPRPRHHRAFLQACTIWQATPSKPELYAHRSPAMLLLEIRNSKFEIRNHPIFFSHFVLYASCPQLSLIKENCRGDPQGD